MVLNVSTGTGTPPDSLLVGFEGIILYADALGSRICISWWMFGLCEVHGWVPVLVLAQCERVGYVGGWAYGYLLHEYCGGR